jgi:hypothetical protein
MSQEQQIDFFISYNKADSLWATGIGNWLDQALYTTALQSQNFVAGSNFVSEMNAALTQAKCVIAIISPDYFSAPFPESEWTAAFARDPTGSGSGTDGSSYSAADDFGFGWYVDSVSAVAETQGDNTFSFNMGGGDYVYDGMGTYTIKVDAAIYESWGYDCYAEDEVDIVVVGVDSITASCDQEIESTSENMVVPPGATVSLSASPYPTDVTSFPSGGTFLWYEEDGKGSFSSSTAQAPTWTAPSESGTYTIKVDYGATTSQEEYWEEIEIEVGKFKAVTFARDLLPIENNAVFDDHHDVGYVVEDSSGNQTWKGGDTVGLFADAFEAAAAGYILWIASFRNDEVGWVDGSVGNNLSGIPAGSPLYISTTRTREEYEQGTLLLEAACGSHQYHLAIHNCQHWAAEIFPDL